MRSIAPLFLVLLMACAGDSAKSPQPQNELPLEQPVETQDTAPPAVDAQPVAEPPANDCVKECVAARQMQATSVEQIEADCAAQCKGDESDPLK